MAVVLLPTVLLLMVMVVPVVVDIPMKPCETVAVAPASVIEPITLFDTLETAELPDNTMPELLLAVVLLVVEVMDPVPVPLPMVLRVILPTLTEPADT